MTPLAVFTGLERSSSLARVSGTFAVDSVPRGRHMLAIMAVICVMLVAICDIWTDSCFSSTSAGSTAGLGRLKSTPEACTPHLVQRLVVSSAMVVAEVVVVLCSCTT